LRPELLIFLNKQINQSPKLVAVGKVRRDRVWSAVFNYLVVDLYKIFSRKRLFQSAKLINYASKSPDVDLSVVRLPKPNFRRRVARGAAGVLCLDVLFGCEVFR
jgi:hypothetical protein